MNLIFLHSNGRETVVSETATEENVYTKIKEFVTDLNPKYKIPYFRSWATKRGVQYDIGSHTEFFLLEGGNSIDQV